jgi:hypothetical protein
MQSSGVVTIITDAEIGEVKAQPLKKVSMLKAKRIPQQ